MRPIYLVIFLLCFFSKNGILLAQESTDSLQIQSSDSSAFDLEQTDLSSQYDYLSDSFRILYAILLFIIAFILSIYLRQPLQRLSEHKTRYSHIFKQIVPFFLVIFFICEAILTGSLKCSNTLQHKTTSNCISSSFRLLISNTRSIPASFLLSI